MSNFQFLGGKELQNSLLEIESLATRRNIGRRALIKAAQTIADAAIAGAPELTGFLKRAIVVSARQPRGRRDKQYFSVAVWLDKTLPYRRLVNPTSTVSRSGKSRRREYATGSAPAVYGVFQEFGTSKIPARGYFRKAWEQVGGENSLNEISRELGIELDKALARISRKAARAAR